MSREDENNEDPPTRKLRYLNCTVEDAVKYSVISSVVPFVIVTILHIAYALSYPGLYNANSTSVLLIILNVLCIIPYLSWIIFIVLVVWFIVLFSTAGAAMATAREFGTGGLQGGGVLSDRMSVTSGDPSESASVLSSLLSSSQSTLDTYSNSSTFSSDRNLRASDSSNNLSFSELSQSISEFD